MHLPMIMGYLLGTATRKDLLSLLYTHRVKAKDKLKCTYDNMFSAKIGEKKTLLSTSWKNWNKILKRKIMKWGWLQLKLDSKQYSLQNPLPLCCLRLIVEALSYLKLKFTFDTQNLLSQEKLASPLCESSHCVASPRGTCPLCFGSNSI